MKKSLSTRMKSENQESQARTNTNTVKWREKKITLMNIITYYRTHTLIHTLSYILYGKCQNERREYGEHSHTQSATLWQLTVYFACATSWASWLCAREFVVSFTAYAFNQLAWECCHFEFFLNWIVLSFDLISFNVCRKSVIGVNVNDISETKIKKLHFILLFSLSCFFLFK